MICYLIYYQLDWENSVYEHSVWAKNNYMFYPYLLYMIMIFLLSTKQQMGRILIKPKWTEIVCFMIYLLVRFKNLRSQFIDR